MPDIILPRRIGGPASRGRPVRAPTAADVPRAGLVSDPGLNVNEKQFGDSSGLEALGQAVSDTGKIIDAEVKRQQKTDAEVERQQKLVDATESGKRRSQFSRHAGDQLTRAVTEGDFTQEVERDLYTTFLDNLKVESLRGLEGGEAQKISPDARARLETSLDDMSSIFRSRAAKLHLNAVQQLGIDQLAVSRNAGANRVHVDPDSLEAELDLLEMSVAEFSGSFIANQERDALSKGREAYIESAVLGLVKQGRAEEAQALLQNEEIAGHLDEATRAGLKKNTEALAHAHDRDLIERGKRGIAEEATAREGAALAFTIDFRPRLKTGEATLAEIATAETGGILTPARADRLRSDLADDQNRRETIAARAEKVTSALQTGGHLNPEDFDDHDDVGHHYAATLRPSLAELDPAQKAAAISGYVADTGIAPEAALKTLLGLTATGEAQGRIAAAHALTALFEADPTARDRVPPPLADFAELIQSLTDTDAIPPDEIIKVGDGLIRDLSPGTKEDQPNPGLILLAKAQTNAQPGVADENDVPPDAAPQQFRPDGRLGRASNEAAELARILKGNKDRGGDESANPRRSRRSGSFGETLNDAESSAEGRNEANDRRASGNDVLRDDNDEMFTEEQLNELPPEDITDGPTKDPNKSQFGGRDLRDMTTEDLKERFAKATAGLQDQARELDKLNREKLAAQDKEEPTRREIKKLEKELKVKLGAAGVASLADLVKKRVLAPTAFVDLAMAILGEAEIKNREKDLDTAFGKTKKVEAKEDAQRKL